MIWTRHGYGAHKITEVVVTHTIAQVQARQYLGTDGVDELQDPPHTEEGRENLLENMNTGRIFIVQKVPTNHVHGAILAVLTELLKK